MHNSLAYVCIIVHCLGMGYKIETTELYDAWYSEQSPKFQAQVEKRLSNIKNQEHFGAWKNLGDGIAEIKFNNGARIYFAKVETPEKTVVLLLGGNKNGQSKDITKAKGLLSK